MPNNDLSRVIDPKFPSYVYAAKPLLPVYAASSGSKKIASLFLGEWMKILDDPIPAEGRIHVRYRGGTFLHHAQ